MSSSFQASVPWIVAMIHSGPACTCTSTLPSLLFGLCFIWHTFARFLASVAATIYVCPLEDRLLSTTQTSHSFEDLSRFASRSHSVWSLHVVKRQHRHPESWIEADSWAPRKIRGMYVEICRMRMNALKNHQTSMTLCDFVGRFARFCKYVCWRGLACGYPRRRNRFKSSSRKVSHRMCSGLKPSLLSANTNKKKKKKQIWHDGC